MFYWITLVGFIAIYIIGIFGMKYINKKIIINIIFPFLFFLFSLTNTIYFYYKVGFNDWNFQNTLPVANISPFMFFTSLIIIVLPNKLKKYVNTLILLLSLGMFGAGMLSLIFNAIRDYNYYWFIILDSFNHLLFSLYGIYLLKTNQICKENKKIILSGSLIIFVSLVMLVLNLIFQTSFFGLSLFGNHSIYNIVISDSSLLSAFIYFIGLIIILCLGWLYSRFIKKKIYSNR